VASGLNRKKQSIDYPNIPSAIRPVPHGEDLPVPESPKDYILMRCQKYGHKKITVEIHPDV
jgi:hypothetical protein